MKASTRCPSLKIIILLDDIVKETRPLSRSNTHIKSSIVEKEFGDVLKLGKTKPLPPVISPNSDIFTIIYTSGSTGLPKGVVFTHGAWLADMISYPQDLLVGVSYQPLSHIVDRHQVAVTFFNGGRMGMIPDPSKIFEDIKWIKPTILFGVPRFYNLIYNQWKVLKEIYSEEEAYLEVKKAFGDRLSIIVSGGAEMPDYLAQFLKQCFKSQVIIGYGTTESGNIALNNNKLKDLDWKLLDLPELGYASTDKPYPRGELCVKNENMFKGYYNDPKRTNDAFYQGYFCTGDIVEIQGDHFRVIARCKETTKLPNGEFVQPARLEAIYGKCKWIHQIYVHATGTHDSLIGVVVISPHSLSAYQKKYDIECLKVKENRDFHNKVLRSLIKVGAMEGCQRYELLSALIVLPFEEKFTVDNGCLNSSFKIQRAAVVKLYKKEIDSIYAILQNKKNFNIFDILDLKLSEADKRSLSFRQLGKDSTDAVIVINQLKTTSNCDLSHFVKDLLTNEVPLSVVEKQFEVKQSMVGSDLLKPDLLFESELDNTIKPTLNIQKPQNVNVVFVTGASGFVGGYFLTELLKSTTCRVYCLARSHKSIEKSLSQSSQWEEIRALFEDRVEIILGDLSLLHLGLSDESYNKIATTADAIVHLGANVNLRSNYFELRNVNVDSTIEVLKIASQSRLKHVHYVSTTDVLTDSYEEIFSLSQTPNNSGYAQTKWVSEKLVVEAQSRGIPTTIYRIGMTYGSAQTGYVLRTDFLSRFLLAAMLTKTLPDMGDAQQNLIPVDFVAKVLVVALFHPSPGIAFHIINPHGSTKFSFFGSCLESSLGIEMKKETYQDWLKWVVMDGNPLQPLWIIDPEQKTFPLFGSKSIVSNKFIEFCTKHNLCCPHITQSYMEKVIDYLVL